ncbi:MAG: relaxase/mobilization nuclease domain-containing protein [Bacteroidales bacterium]|nr:MAG: relaxase/mobilization nuclease domain-containing protein [Bacteroidales bacterium]
MVGKTKTGSGFKGVIYYNLQKSKDSEILFSNGLASNDMKGLIKEFETIRGENPNISKPVWHTSLSFAHEDNISNDKMAEIAQKFMEKAGFSLENNQFIVIKHNDKDHRHCHIVSNRVGFNGRAVSDFFFKSKTVQWAKELEKEYGLTVVQEVAKARKVEKNNEFIPDKEQLKETITKTLESKGITSLEELSLKLKEKGVDMEILKHSRTGKEYGVNFKIGENTYKGSDLGKKFAYKALYSNLSPALKIATKIISKGISNGL